MSQLRRPLGFVEGVGEGNLVVLERRVEQAGQQGVTIGELLLRREVCNLLMCDRSLDAPFDGGRDAGYGDGVGRDVVPLNYGGPAAQPLEAFDGEPKAIGDEASSIPVRTTSRTRTSKSDRRLR
jgi:hypothetical protein